MIASLAGLLTGIAAGFVGVGGGEFRIPVLVRLMRLPVAAAAGVNLIVGLFTVSLSVYRRWGHQTLADDAWSFVGFMGAASIAGAIFGVTARKRIPVRILITVVRIYLIVVGVWMVYESVSKAEHVLFDPTGALRWILAAAVAFLIAVASGILGVAGGEMRIPALLYLFGVPIVQAGTLSLLVSIPTLAGAAGADRRLGGIPNSAVRIAAIMGAGSIVGVLIGASLIPYADRHIIKGVLGAVLLLAAVRLQAPTDPVA